MNEAGEYERATAYIKRWTRRFERYAMGLPGLGDLSEALRIVGERVGRTWRTMGHREAYVMARKAMLSEPDLREDSIASYCMALDMDNQPRPPR
jgi:hypothetical protein